MKASVSIPQAPQVTDLSPELVLDLSPLLTMTPTLFARFCEANPELVVELNPAGEIEVMSPVKRNTSWYESVLIGELYAWNKTAKLGITGSPSGGYKLPNAAVRAPDASWYTHERLALLSAADDVGFPALVPDFVAEIRSATDRLNKLQDKMLEYQSVGVRLGWLLDPTTQTAYIYPLGQAVRIVDLTAQPVLLGEDVLPSFSFDTRLFQSI
jgi:Uma2 family endonuclease